METLVVAEHRNQFYRSKSQISDGFGSSPSKGFRDINCRAFHSEEGILPTPFKSCSSTTTSVTTKICSSPKTPELEAKSLKSKGKSSSIPINFNKCRTFNDDFSDSELWAGPAYCNSPPPSSLPIPKFSLRQKRSVSFELPAPPSGISLHPVAKSAPPSPGRDPLPSPTNFFLTAASATKDLRRMLNLNIDED